MKNIMILLGLCLTVLGNAQDKVGIETETPTERLDVNGGMRVRNLVNANGNDTFNRIVFATENQTSTGTFGYKTQDELESSILVYQPDHIAQDLLWYTSNTTAGTQTIGEKKMIFGSYNELGVTAGQPWNRPADFFSVNDNDFLDINAILSFRVIEVDNSGNDNRPLNTISQKGDRQVIFHIYLYKGTELVRESKQTLNFNGRDDASISGGNIDSKYQDVFTENITLNYIVPNNEGATDYNVSVVAELKAPNDSNFGIDFKNNVKQYLFITRN